MGEDKRGEERRSSLRKAAACLEEKADEVKDETCKSWLTARQTCFADAQKDNICPTSSSSSESSGLGKKLLGKENTAAQNRGKVMMCLRTVGSEKLSAECTNSDFYKAIIGLRRFNKQSRMNNREKKRKEKLDKLAEHATQ